MDIDFVILWIDGSDPEWRKDFVKYNKIEDRSDKSEIRFRDWDNLHYIFRAFEKYTPWVRKIHFVTWGHLPPWLNKDHKKLHIVNHGDYIDSIYLSVFNANSLEINLHRISGLSEKFVFFNDDTFLNSTISKERFFRNNLPCDMLVSNTLSSSSGVGHFVLNNLEILNRHINKREALKKNLVKWFNYQYGFNIMRNLVLLPWARFTGFVDPHQPQPFLKSTFDEVWEKESKTLEQTSASKFRSCSDVNQYLFRYWQLAKGDFIPISMKDTKYITMKMDNLRSGEVANIITSQKYSMVCLNDSESIKTDEELEEAKQIIKDAFEKILPEKSSFEL